MRFNKTSKVVTNIRKRPVRKNISAICSYLGPNFEVDRMERKERMLLIMKKRIAPPVNSSINEASHNLPILREVSTMKHNPSRLDEVFSI